MGPSIYVPLSGFLKTHSSIVGLCEGRNADRRRGLVVDAAIAAAALLLLRLEHRAHLRLPPGPHAAAPCPQGAALLLLLFLIFLLLLLFLLLLFLLCSSSSSSSSSSLSSSYFSSPSSSPCSSCRPAASLLHQLRKKPHDYRADARTDCLLHRNQREEQSREERGEPYLFSSVCSCCRRTS